MSMHNAWPRGMCNCWRLASWSSESFRCPSPSASTATFVSSASSNSNEICSFINLHKWHKALKIIMPPNEQYNMNARMLRIDTASFPNGTFHDNNTTDDPTASPSLIPPIPEIDKTGAVVMLIGLVWLMFGILSWPCIRPSLQILQIRFFGKRKTAKRYRTVDSWLITKVCAMICYWRSSTMSVSRCKMCCTHTLILNSGGCRTL